MKLNRRGFLAWAMATAITLHLAPGLARAAPPESIVESFPPEACYSAFPICFMLHFTKAKHRVYLPIVEK